MLYRAIWLSDMHLGTRGCNATAILSFLKDHDAETIYLVGDIIDGWRLKRRFYWPQLHNDVVQKLLRKSRKGTRIVYITGNHDEFLRPFVGQNFGSVELLDEVVHTTVSGQQMLVLHGDKFDGIVHYHRWMALLGDWSYTVLLAINRWLAAVRDACGLGRWSLSACLKRKVKQAANFINNFESALAEECRSRGFDGIICGHIHHAEIRPINGILYCNTGDWVESCTAIVEDFEGTLSIARFEP